MQINCSTEVTIPSFFSSQFITVFAACLAVSSAGLIPAATPFAAAPFAAAPLAAAPVAVAHAARLEEFDPHPQYTYGYDVKDALSGDSKTQVESRDGQFVQGQYSLNDADGYRRIVDYTADDVNGFNAVVRREPLVAAAVAAPAPIVRAAPVAAPLAAAPVAAYATAPAAYTAPIVKTAVAAPVATYAAAPFAAAPAAYTAPLHYAAAPAPIIKAASPFAPAVVRTNFASPLINYAY